MKTYDFDQYSPEWFAVRRGIPTASEFHRIITAKQGKSSAQAHGYLCRLIGDRFDIDYPRVNDNATAAMKRGTQFEPEARRFYEFDRDTTVAQVGFCTTDDGRLGCSPDGLVGDDGLIEIKCPSPEVHVAYILDGGLPDDYRPQVHGQLLVTGRSWCDFLSYCPGLPNFIVRVEADEFTTKLRCALEDFLARYDELLARFTPKEMAA
jgi:putative phage-type endonuclease